MVSDSLDASPLATLTLLYKPADHIHTVHEQVTRRKTELYRNIQMTLRVPDRGLATLEPPTSSKEKAKFYIPLLTPKKDALVDIQELSISRKGKELDCSITNHKEHQAISKSLIEARFKWTYRNVVALKPYVKDALEADLKRLLDIVPQEPRIAEAIIEELFAEEPHQDHQLRSYSGTERPADEPRLRALCDLLATQYLLLAVTHARIGDELTVSYRHRQRYVSEPEEGQRLRRFFGGYSGWLRFRTPLAKRTNHYDFKYTVQEGYFVNTQGAYAKDKATGAASRLTSGLHTSPTRGPVESVEPGGTSVSHVLINNGSHTEQYLDIGITTDELPPGSIGFAVAIIALQLPILALARVIIDYRFLQGGIDMPALVVSLISSLPLISGVFFARTELSQSPLLSRATVFGGAVLGNLYALWLTIAASEPRNGGVGRLTSLVDWLAQWADDVILLLLLLLLVRASGRMCRIAFRFAKRMRGDESQPVDLRGPGAVL